MSDLIYSRKRVISSTSVSSENYLSVWHAVRFLQDSTTECFQKLNCDGIKFKELGAMWIFTKSRVKFYKMPFWTDEIEVRTFPSSNTGIRTNICTEFRSKTGELLIAANQEMCTLSFETHRPLKLTDLPYPKENFPPVAYSEPYEKFSIDSSALERVFTQKIYSQMIDMNCHLNNTEYVRMAMNAFSHDFLASHEVDVLEVHYLGESQEGQELTILKTEKDGKFYIQIKQEERTVFEMMIQFK